MAIADLCELIKSQNELLSLLLINGPMMRSDIAQLLDITISAVTHRTNHLAKANLIQEYGETGTQVGPGRRSQLIGVNPNGAYTVGIHNLHYTELEVGIVDFTGRVVANRKLDVSSDIEQDMMITADAIKVMLEEKRISFKKVLGVGIATVGATNAKKGLEYRYRIANQLITPIPIPTAQILSKYLPKPIEMATKAQAMATAERWFSGNYNNYLLVHVDYGVGSAIVLNGYVYKAQDNVGTIGHIKTSTDGPLCTCGERGCLEALVERDKLLERINKVSQVSDIYQAVDLAKDGNEKIGQVLLETAINIALVCAPLVDALEPDAIIFVGPIFDMPEVLKTIEQYFNKHTFIGRLHKVNVVPSTYGKNAGIVGAASLVIDALFQDGLTPNWPNILGPI